MPERETLERAREDKAEGKAPSTQAGEFIREEMHHIREGKHGARNTKQAIAIGLSKARRAGVKLPTPKRGSVSAKTRRSIARESHVGRDGHHKPSNRSFAGNLAGLATRRPRRSVASGLVAGGSCGSQAARRGFTFGFGPPGSGNAAARAQLI